MLIQIQKEFLHHLLYVMDGVLTCDEYLKDYPKDYDGTIPKVTYETSFDQVKVAKVNAEGCISFCINSIKDRPIYLIYPKGTTGVLPIAPLNYWELYHISLRSTSCSLRISTWRIARYWRRILNNLFLFLFAQFGQFFLQLGHLFLLSF